MEVAMLAVEKHKEERDTQRGVDERDAAVSFDVVAQIGDEALGAGGGPFEEVDGEV